MIEPPRLMVCSHNSGCHKRARLSRLPGLPKITVNSRIKGESGLPLSKPQHEESKRQVGLGP